jgi:hypothetical protein
LVMMVMRASKNTMPANFQSGVEGRLHKKFK